MVCMPRRLSHLPLPSSAFQRPQCSIYLRSHINTHVRQRCQLLNWFLFIFVYIVPSTPKIHQILFLDRTYLLCRIISILTLWHGSVATKGGSQKLSSFLYYRQVSWIVCTSLRVGFIPIGKQYVITWLVRQARVMTPSDILRARKSISFKFKEQDRSSWPYAWRSPFREGLSLGMA